MTFHVKPPKNTKNERLRCRRRGIPPVIASDHRERSNPEPKGESLDCRAAPSERTIGKTKQNQRDKQEFFQFGQRTIGLAVKNAGAVRLRLGFGGQAVLEPSS